jgi:hypothetical protein
MVIKIVVRRTAWRSWYVEQHGDHGHIEQHGGHGYRDQGHIEKHGDHGQIEQHGECHRK